MRILLSNPDTLGDLVLRQPLFAALQAAGHELMLIVRPACADLVPYVAPGALVLRLPHNPHAPDLEQHWDEFSELFAAAKTFKPDLYVIAPFQWTPFEQRLGATLEGVPRLAMNGCIYAGGPNSDPAPPSQPNERRIDVQVSQPELEKTRALASAILGQPVPQVDPRISSDPRSLTAARAALGELHLAPGNFWIACVTGVANVPIKTWPANCWAQLLGTWAREYGRKFLFIGLPDEEHLADEVRDAMGSDASFTAILDSRHSSLDTLLGLMSLSSGYVGHDTGPMHLAAALGKPVLGVFGGGTWPRFLPAVNPSCALTVSVPCAGCNWACPFVEPYCIRTVPPDEVLKAARELEEGIITTRQSRVLAPTKQTVTQMIRHSLTLGAERYRLYTELAAHGRLLEKEQQEFSELHERLDLAQAETALLRAAALTERGEGSPIASASTLASRNPAIRTPDVLWPPGDVTYRPSWTRPDLYINDEHTGIYQATKDLPGWQDPADSEKLYEMAYYNGGVILEIGVFGGRSAVVELKGTLSFAQEHSTPVPHFFGVDLDPAAIPRSFKSLSDHKLAQHALLYQGTLRQFHRDIPIVPTMVFVDGDHNYPGCIADLNLLRTFLAPGTPVLCHDYAGIEGVHRAVDDAVSQGGYNIVGQFAGSILLSTTADNGGAVAGLESKTFAKIRDALAARYTVERAKSVPVTGLVDVRAETRPARVELGIGSDAPGAGGYGAWPFAVTDVQPMPDTLPNGKPWPRITIVTPSYNQGRYIEQTLLSVLNQNYPNLEFIVVDGVSTDETHTILRRYRHRLSHLLIQKDKGQADAINKGFKLGTGQILTWLNSDDMLCPGALHAMAMAFHTSGADIVAGICIQHREGSITGRHLTACVDGPLPLDELLDLENRWLQGQFFYQPEVMFTRAIWEKAGARLDDTLFFSLDYELWLRFAQAGANVHVIGRPIALFRVHEKQKTFDPMSFQPELKEVRKRFLRRLGRTPSLNGSTPAPTAPLRIVFFNDLGGVGGAAIAHLRLASALAAAGCEIFPIAVMPDLCNNPPPIEELMAAIETHRPDLVVLGNLHAACIPPAFLEKVSDQFPTIEVTHDFWALTGRCPYTGDCTKYLTGCDESCPTQTEYPVIPVLQIKPNWEDKLRALTSPRGPALAPVSRYAEKFIRARFASDPTLLAPAILPVRNGVPVDIFRPRDRATCRDILKLPQDRFIILFSATNLNDKRKGLQHFLDAIDLLQLGDLLAVCIGHLDPAMAQTKDPRFHAFGYVNDPQTLAMLYSASDLFVGPSLIETFGQVFIEAAACGTPSIGYPAGGITDAIANGLSGRLAAAMEPQALADAIDELHQNPRLRRQMGAWGRLWVENEWSLAAIAQKFLSQLRACEWTRKPTGPVKVSFGSQTPHPAVYLRGTAPPVVRPEFIAAEQNDRNLARILQSRLNLLASSRLLRAAWAIGIMPRPPWVD